MPSDAEAIQFVELAGKDWFSEKEAARYCCVSIDHFRKNIRKTDLKPRKLWGKKIYKKVELEKLIEEESSPWPQSNGASTSGSQAKSQRPPSLIGVKEAASAANH